MTILSEVNAFIWRFELDSSISGKTETVASTLGASVNREGGIARGNIRRLKKISMWRIVWAECLIVDGMRGMTPLTKYVDVRRGCVGGSEPASLSNQHGKCT